MPGFGARLQKELAKLYPDTPVEVHEMDNKVTIPWRGASLMVKDDVNSDQWVTAAEFEKGHEDAVREHTNAFAGVKTGDEHAQLEKWSDSDEDA